MEKFRGRRGGIGSRRQEVGDIEGDNGGKRWRVKSVMRREMEWKRKVKRKGKRREESRIRKGQDDRQNGELRGKKLKGSQWEGRRGKDKAGWRGSRKDKGKSENG